MVSSTVLAAGEPSKPVLYSPDNNENIKENQPTFEWEHAENVENYRLVIDNSKNFDDGDNEYDNTHIPGSENTVTIENVLANGVWYWKVAAENFTAGLENWSENTWTFRVDTVPPAAPSLTSPDNNDNMNDNTPTFSWSATTPQDNSLPITYHIWIDNNSNFGSPEYENSNVTTTSIEIESELNDDLYYWHVAARDNAGNTGENSENWIFRVDKLMPELVSPSDGENTNENTPTFKWDNAVTADNWEIWIDNKSDWATAIIDNETDNTYNLSTELEDNVYYWRVRGYKDSDVSIFSSVWTFRVDTVSPAKPSQTWPTNGENTNDNTPNLEWQLVPSENSTPVLYRVHVSDNSQFPYDNYGSGWVSDDNYQLTSELSEGTWYWRVQAKDNAGNIGDNRQTSFRVDVTPPTISGLTESGVDKDSATIEWTTDEPADSIVEYGKTQSYGSTKSDTSLVTSHSITLTGLDPDNTYHYRVKSTDNAGNTTTTSDQQFTTPALSAPTSSVDLIDPYWRTSSFTIGATASDTDGSVENVTLYYRYRENSSASWGSWTSFGTDTSSPWRWSFGDTENDGLYEFYTRATDDDAQTESAPASADEDVGFDTTSPTLSSVQINGENTVTSSVSVTISIDAEDATSGLDQVRFSDDNETWASWESFATEKSYDLSLPDGTKTVYVQVKDTAGLTSSVLDNSILLENATFTESIGPISENSNKTADFANWGLAVKEVILYSKENTPIHDAEVNLRVLENKPAEITVEEPGTTAFYFEVETNAPSENLDKIAIRFDVKKSWLEDQGVESDEVKLWKLNTKWKSIPVAIENDNTTHVHYSTTVSDLSWFTVTAEAPIGGIGLAWIVIGIAIIAVIIIALIGWWWKQTRGPIFKRGGIPKRKLRSIRLMLVYFS